jgi:hypothetical protein
MLLGAAVLRYPGIYHYLAQCSRLIPVGEHYSPAKGSAMLSRS